jgi:hypothetical protein
MRKILSICFGMVLLASASTYADLIMTYDLRLKGGGKSANVTSANETVELELYALLTSSDGIANEGVMKSSSRFTSIESSPSSFVGNIHDATRSFTGSTWSSTSGSNGSTYNYDSNSDAEWGGAFPTATNTNYLTNLEFSTWHYGTEIKLAELQWTAEKVTAAGNTVTLQVAPYVNNTTGKGVWKFCSDGITKTDDLNSTYLRIGDPVVLTSIVPEPSTWILLALGALALLATGRRK